MPFSVPLTSTLSGATVDQLAYWRRRTAAGDDPLLVPSARRSGRFLYSWADVVALRSIVYLRQEKSLPKIRKAVETLVRLEADEWEHLAEYRFVRTADTIVVVTRRGRLIDLERSPGTMLEDVLMQDVLNPFETEHGRRVPALRQPRPRITVDPGVLAGYPVVAGTRVPYDVVASLVEDGYDEAEIVELYPSVRPEAVADAHAFAKDVASAA
jgi:uncharacterized protein (DUF433 family)/DNA-binding transcriptional MerR regulator